MIVIPYKEIESKKTKELERELIAVPRSDPHYKDIIHEYIESEKDDIKRCVTQHPDYLPCECQDNPYCFKLREKLP